MKNISFCMLLCWCSCSSLFAQWANINSLNYVRWENLDFPSEQRGYGLTDSDSLYRSIDAGQNWQLLNPTVTGVSNPDIQSLHFPSADTGYLLVRASQNQQLSSMVWKTTDGGQSWTDQSPTNMAIGFGNSDIHFISADLGYAAIGHEIYKTVDGGQTWTSHAFNPIGGVMDIDFLDENNGIVGFWDGSFAYSGTIYTTNDGGQSWDSLVFNDLYSSMDRVDFASADVVYSLEQGAWNGTQRLFKSVDAGRNWDSIQLTFLTDSSDRAVNIYFLNEDKGYMTTYDGRIFKTSDAGLSWTEEYNYGAYGLEEIAYNGLAVFVAGPLNVLLSNDFNTATEQLHSEDHLEVFPNPVAAGQPIFFKTPISGSFRLLNLAGQTLQFSTLYQQNQVMLSRYLAPGVYFLELSGKLRHQQKIIIR